MVGLEGYGASLEFRHEHVSNKKQALCGALLLRNQLGATILGTNKLHLIHICHSIFHSGGIKATPSRFKHSRLWYHEETVI